MFSSQTERKLAMLIIGSEFIAPVSYVISALLCVTLDVQMVVIGFCGGCY